MKQQRTLTIEEAALSPDDWLQAIENVANAPTTFAGNAAGAEILLKAVAGLRAHLLAEPSKTRGRK